MSKYITDDRIPDDVLAEQWYGLMHQVIGKVQEAYREAAKSGLNQKTIAARLGKKSPEVISRCLSGQKNMTLRTLHELARAMDCRLDVSVTPLKNIQPSNRTVAIAREHTEKMRTFDTTRPSAITSGQPVYRPTMKVKEYA